MTLRFRAAAALYAVCACAALDPQAASVRRKLDLIESGKARRGSVVVFTASELNAWARAQVPTVAPEGVREPKLDLGNNAATATAYVNFLKLRHAAGYQTNWLVAKLIDGEKLVKVNARFESARGRATVYLQRVEISGIAVSGSTLDFLIDTFFMPLYPNAKINQPFDLQDNIDHIEVRPADARVYMNR